MLPFSRAGTNIYLSSLELEMKSISIFIYFYSSWVCGSTLWLHRNLQFLPLLYFLLIFPLIYLCDTLISCLEYLTVSNFFLGFFFPHFSFSFLQPNPWCFLFRVPAFEWPFLIPLSPFHSSVLTTTACCGEQWTKDPPKIIHYSFSHRWAPLIAFCGSE